MPTSPKHNTTNTNLNFLWGFESKGRIGGVYEYSFQAQEHDDEIKGIGNSINYKYRMHDTRLGRFFAVDPLAAKYPWNSTYAFSENRVIDGVELEGLEYQEYYRLTDKEKEILKNNPEIINTLYENRKIAEEETAKKFGDNFRNDESDAFRHALFNALNTISFGLDLAKKLGDAHEDFEGNPDKEKEMDLHNNAVGQNVGDNNYKASKDEIVEIINKSLENGDLYIFEEPNKSNSNLVRSNDKGDILIYKEKVEKIEGTIFVP